MRVRHNKQPEGIGYEVIEESTNFYIVRDHGQMCLTACEKRYYKPTTAENIHAEAELQEVAVDP